MNDDTADLVNRTKFRSKAPEISYNQCLRIIPYQNNNYDFNIYFFQMKNYQYIVKKKRKKRN